MSEELGNQLQKNKSLILQTLVGNFPKHLQAANKVVLVSIKSIEVEAEALNIDEEEAKAEKKEDLINLKEGQGRENKFKEVLCEENTDKKEE